jgi:hypothetical protein
VDTARVLEVLAALPGVATAAAGTALPFGMAAPSDRVSAATGGSAQVLAERVSITPTYFTALDVPMRAGRTFSDSDVSGLTRTAIVNETLARQLWPGRDAMAGRIVVGTTSYEVIGVAAGYSSNPLREPAPRYYLPLVRDPKPARLQIVVRAAHDPRPLIRGVRQEILHLGSAYAVPSLFPMNDVIAIGAREIMALAVAISPLLGIGIFLTATGIFGVLAFAIARRARELALRIALGASRGQVGRVVAMHTFRLLAAGAMLGVGATFGLTRMVHAAGGGGSSFDTPGWQAFAVPVTIVLVVGVFATWIPARRALRIDPATLLKTE